MTLGITIWKNMKILLKVEDKKTTLKRKTEIESCTESRLYWYQIKEIEEVRSMDSPVIAKGNTASCIWDVQYSQTAADSNYQEKWSRS